MSKSNSTIPDRVSSELSSHIEKTFAEQMSHDNFRNKVKEIFADCIETVPFMEKVKVYAGKEIDEQILKNGKAIFVFFLTIIITAFLTAAITSSLSRQSSQSPTFMPTQSPQNFNILTPSPTR